MSYQNFDGCSSATRKTLKEAALEPFSLPKVVEEVVVIKKLLRQNTYEKRLFLEEAKILELDLSQPTSSMLLDFRVYTQK